MSGIPRPGIVAKSFVTLALFSVGVVTGVLAYGRVSADIDYGPYPPKPEAAEPASADRLTDLLLEGNDPAMAEEFDSEIIQQLSGALAIGQQGLIEISDVRYLGTVTQGDEAIANYMAYGKFNSGADAVLGFAVRVRGGDVVGVN